MAEDRTLRQLLEDLFEGAGDPASLELTSFGDLAPDLSQLAFSSYLELAPTEHVEQAARALSSAIETDIHDALSAVWEDSTVPWYATASFGDEIGHFEVLDTSATFPALGLEDIDDPLQLTDEDLDPGHTTMTGLGHDEESFTSIDDESGFADSNEELSGDSIEHDASVALEDHEFADSLDVWDATEDWNGSDLPLDELERLDESAFDAPAGIDDIDDIDG